MLNEHTCFELDVGFLLSMKKYIKVLKKKILHSDSVFLTLVYPVTPLYNRILSSLFLSLSRNHKSTRENLFDDKKKAKQASCITMYILWSHYTMFPIKGSPKMIYSFKEPIFARSAKISSKSSESLAMISNYKGSRNYNRS